MCSKYKSFLESVAVACNEAEKEFVNPFPELATDSEAKELLDMEHEKLAELFLQYKLLTSEASLPSSANNNFPHYIEAEEVKTVF